MESNDPTQTTLASAQHPIHSGFGPASTAEDVIQGIDLSGKTVIVTGGYAGIGLETVRVLHQAGAKVIVPVRNTNKAVQALSGLEGVEIEAMDLMEPESVDAFAAKFLSSARPLHILVNNAAIMANPLTRDAKGYESQFATNHLGHFRLTARLWPALRRAEGARVVIVSSWGHRFSPVIFEDIHFERREYQPFLAYGQSKTANALFTVALDKRGKADGIRAFAVHPGTIISTDLARHLSEEDIRKTGVIDEDGNPVLDPSRQRKNIPQGAATTVWCATSPQLNGMGGVYCENCDISPLVVAEEQDSQLSASRPLGVYPYAIDAGAAERLWKLTEQMTGVTLDNR